MTARKLFAGCAAAAIACTISGGLQAQVLAPAVVPDVGSTNPPVPEVRSQGETVRTRARPEVDPLGVRAGSFLIFPKATVEQSYNDNVYASRHDTKDDFITNVRPEISAQSNWSNHALNFATGADWGLYTDHTPLDYTDWFVSGDGRLDITRDAALFAGGGFAREHEDPGDPETPADAKNPTEYNLINGFTRYVQRFGKFRGVADATVARVDYLNTNLVDGQSQSNSGRDRTTYAGGPRVGYELYPNYEAFVRATGNRIQYDTREGSGGGGVDRNSDGYTAVTGVSLDLGGILFGEVYVGYLQQFFDSSDFGSVGDVNVGGALTWNATTLTTVNARVIRSIEPSAAQPNSPAVLRTSGALSVDHELLRQLIISSAFNVTNDDYVDSNRNDYYWVPGVGIRYLMNRNFYVNLGYQYVHHSTTGRDSTDQSYDQNIVRLGLEAQL